ncbi:MAG: hypothetical protein KDD60_05180, partial [Bdellovibrionales bacterium]|nr:hypothetical protein [Bdellovibrionales bacterium]
MNIRHTLLLIFLGLQLFTPQHQAYAIGKKKLWKVLARDSRKSSLEITNTQTGRYFPAGVNSFYNINTNEFLLTGKLEKIPAAALKKDLKIFVSGRDISNGKVIGNIKLAKPKNKKAKYFGRGKFSAVFSVPVVPDWPILDILVELVNVKTDQVIARDVVSLYDLRYEQNANAQTAADTRPKGMTSQLTDTGVGGVGTLSTDGPEGLEIPLLDSLPYPSLQSFNEKLSQAALNIPEKQAEELENCIDFEDIEEDRFKNITQFGPYASALLEAEGYKQLYDTLSSNQAQCFAYFGPLGVGCQAGLAAWCVKSTPSANDFRLCVKTVKEESSGLQVPAIKDVDLNFLKGKGSGGSLQAQIDFNGYQGEVDGYLRDLEVRWKTSTCILPPKAEVPNELITAAGKEWLYDWTYCPDLLAKTTLATTRNSQSDSALFSIHRHPDDAQSLEVLDARLPSFRYSGAQTDSSSGTCGNSFINGPVDFLLSQFHPAFQSVIASAWEENTPSSPSAQAIDLLLNPLELGNREEPNHRLTARITEVTSAPVAGLKVQYENFAEPITTEDFTNLTINYFSQGSGDPHDGSTGLDPDDVPFDLSFDVTIGLLNSILHARGATDELTFQYEPTSSELAQNGTTAGPGSGVGGGLGGGIGGGGSLPGSLINVLTGTTLSQVHEAFNEIGNKVIEIRIERVLDPITFMLTDPAQAATNADGIQVAYGLNALKITFQEPDEVDAKGAVLKAGK